MCDYCTWIDSVVAKLKAKAEGSQKFKSQANKDPVVVVHGGAGSIPLSKRRYMLAEVKNAAVKAYATLIRGRHCLDAVETAIRHMEGKNYFNCALGGSLDANGEVVMDAAIMDSSSFKAGCVGAVRDIEHPISLARMILHETDHVLIVESGAQRFALAMGIPVLPPGWLISAEEVESSSSSSSILPESEEECEDDSRDVIGQFDPANYELKDKEDGDRTLENVPLSIVEACSGNDQGTGQQPKEKLSRCVSLANDKRKAAKQALMRLEVVEQSEPTFLQVGPVGAIAYDRNGRLASGTSTAGSPGRMTGSTSPIATVIGCGIFADRGGCVSVSGEERTIYAYALARQIVERLNEGHDVGSTLNKELDKFEEGTFESHVGAIALNVHGKPAVSFKCVHFPWAYCELGYVYYGCRKGEVRLERIEELDRPLDCTCEDIF